MPRIAAALRCLVLAGLVPGSGIAWGQTQTTSAPGAAKVAQVGGSRLDFLRESMIDQALESPVRVTSNAWLDESGRLRHVSRFFSEVRARAAADLIVAAESATEARATAAVAGGVKLPGTQVPSAGTAVGADAPQATRSTGDSGRLLSHTDGPDCHPDRSGLVRAALVRSELLPSDGARGNSVLEDLRQLIHDSLLRESGRGGLVLAGVDVSHIDSYSRLISGNGQQDAPYRIDIRISSDRTDVEPHGRGALPGQGIFSLGFAGIRRSIAELEQPGPLLMPDRLVEIELELIDVSAEWVVLRHRLSVVMAGGSTSHNTVAVPESVVAQIRVAAVAWWSEAVSLLRCQPLRVQAKPAGSGVLSIPLGGRVGIRIGDRWMIADRARIPSRILEQGAVERIMMAEVVTVGQHRSILRLTAESVTSSARPGLERGVQWFASPL